MEYGCSYECNLKNLRLTSAVPDRNGIEGIAHNCDGTCGEPYNNCVAILKSMKAERTKVNDVKLTSRVYQYKGYSEHFMVYR